MNKQIPDWLIPVVCLLVGVPLFVISLLFDDRLSIVLVARWISGILIFVGVMSVVYALPFIVGMWAARKHKERRKDE